MDKIKGEFIQVVCPVCESEDFENVDYLKKLSATQKLMVCHTCGHVMYNPQPTNESLIKFYKEKYRGKVEIGNILTCNRKLEYHKAFLGKRLEEGNGKSMLDIGCSFGYLLNYAKQKGWKVAGTEHTVGHVNFAKYDFKLDIKGKIEDFEHSIIDRFDMIVYYHVLEHIQNPHIELCKARERLADDGLLYVAIPFINWLRDSMGTGIRALDDAFPVEHINMFTHQAFLNLLGKVGFKPIQTNNFYYGLTVLCKKCEPKTDIQARDYRQIIQVLANMQKAIQMCNAGDLEGATETFPKFPQAWIQLAVRAKKFNDSQDILFRALKVMPTIAEISEHIGHNYYRNNQFQNAKDTYSYALALRPGNEAIVRHIGLCLAEMGNYKDAVKWFKKGLQINPAQIADWYKWIGWAYSKMD